MTERVVPTSPEEVARVLARAGATGRRVRILGGGTKRSWGADPGREADLELSTLGLDRLLAHDPGDLTAEVGAGMTLGRLSERLAVCGQRLALDPPHAESATVGGVLATADGGPLEHRYGGVARQVLGVTVALSDGRIIRTGARVRRNVAGYDLPRLFCGSYGTLGVILTANLRLVPIEQASATALGVADSPRVAVAAVTALARSGLDLSALDIAWRGGRGGILARLSGPGARRRAGRAAAAMAAVGLTGTDVTERDGDLWARQRSGQRSTSRAVVRVNARPSQLAGLLEASDACGGTLVGRAARGMSYVELAPERVIDLRRRLPSDAHAELLDRPARRREAGASASIPDLPAESDSAGGFGGSPWGSVDPGVLELMRAVKARFDPAGVCNPGRFAGGI